MTMFTELYALATTATLSMVISADEKSGTLTISVMPKPKKDMGEAALTKDLTLTATPAEFDSGFVAGLAGYRQARDGLIEQAEATREVLEAAKHATAKKAAQAVTKAATPAAKAAARTEEPDESDSGEPESVPQTSVAVPTTDGAQPNLFS